MSGRESRAATLVLAGLEHERGGWVTPAGSLATRNLSVYPMPPRSPEIGTSNLEPPLGPSFRSNLKFP